MRTLLPITLCCCFAIPAVAADPVTPTFETHVRPILKAYCFQCHGDANPLKGKLDLRLARTIAKGGKSGPALTPGQPEASLLLKRVRAGEMPPGKKKLGSAEIEVIARWVAGGAMTQRAEPEVIAAGFQR